MNTIVTILVVIFPVHHQLGAASGDLHKGQADGAGAEAGGRQCYGDIYSQRAAGECRREGGSGGGGPHH